MAKSTKIQQNFLLKYRNRNEYKDRSDAKRRKEKLKIKACFGHHSCENPRKCPTRMECLEKKVERIRKEVLGEKLYLKFKRKMRTGNSWVSVPKQS